MGPDPKSAELGAAHVCKIQVKLSNLKSHLPFGKVLVPQEGLEPPTLSLRRTCSTS